MKERHTELEAQHQLFFSHSLIIRFATFLTVWFHTDIRVTDQALGRRGGSRIFPRRKFTAKEWRN